MSDSWETDDWSNWDVGGLDFGGLDLGGLSLGDLGLSGFDFGNSLSDWGIDTYSPAFEDIGIDNSNLFNLGSDLTAGLGMDQVAALDTPYDWDSWDQQANDYVAQYYPDVMVRSINDMGTADLRNSLNDQIYGGANADDFDTQTLEYLREYYPDLVRNFINPTEADNFMQGLTSDGQTYNWSSPEQNAALAAQAGAGARLGSLNQSAVRNISAATGITPADIVKQAVSQAKDPATFGGSKGVTPPPQIQKALQLSKALKGALGLARAIKGDEGISRTARGTAAPVSWGSTGERRVKKLAQGGPVGNGGLGSITIALADAAQRKGMVKGKDKGQADTVDAKLSPGEYVMDAETVSALGDGNTEAGAAELDKMRYNIRKHKRSGGLNTIAAAAKPAEQYLKGKK